MEIKQDRTYKYDKGILTETIKQTGPVKNPSDSAHDLGTNQSTTVNVYDEDGAQVFIDFTKGEYEKERKKLEGIEKSREWLKDVQSDGAITTRLTAILQEKSKRGFKDKLLAFDKFAQVFMEKLQMMNPDFIKQEKDTYKNIEKAMENMRSAGVKL